MRKEKPRESSNPDPEHRHARSTSHSFLPHLLLLVHTLSHLLLIIIKEPCMRTLKGTPMTGSEPLILIPDLILPLLIMHTFLVLLQHTSKKENPQINTT